MTGWGLRNVNTAVGVAVLVLFLLPVIVFPYQTLIFGTSHADGSYRNCGTSIPISYFLDSTGRPIYISKNDLRSRIIDLQTGSFEILEERR